MIALFLDTSSSLILGLLKIDSQTNECSWIKHLHLIENKSSAIIHRHIYELLQSSGIADPKNIDLLFEVAGPGSYTGMRISHGIADVFELIGKKRVIFYHFDSPWYTGEPIGVWLTKAFKNEIFCHLWFDSSLAKKENSNANLELFNKVKNLVQEFETCDISENSQLKVNDLNSQLKTFKALIPENTFGDLFLKMKDLFYESNSFLKTINPFFTHNQNLLNLPNLLSKNKEKDEVDLTFIETDSLIKNSISTLYKSLLLEGDTSKRRPYYFRPLTKEFRSFKN